MKDNSTPHATHESGANQAGSFSISMKPPLTYRQQVALMASRGLVIEDEASAMLKLSAVNYYRLRGYWLTYERDGRFTPGTTFDMIWDTYLFDAEFRNLVWALISPVEIKARTSLAYHMSHESGPFSYKDAEMFHDAGRHAKSMAAIDREIERAKRDRVPCVLHNLERYGDLPIWAAVEVMSMGTISQLYGNLDPNRCDAQKAVAADFGVKPFLLKSWLRHLTYVRNICGHHSRLYNRVMTVRPTLMRADAGFDGNKELPTIVVLKRIYERLWPEAWPRAVERLGDAVESHPSVSVAPLGFPRNWIDVIR